MARLALFGLVGLISLGTILWLTNHNQPTHPPDTGAVSSRPNAQPDGKGAEPHTFARHPDDSHENRPDPIEKTSESARAHNRAPLADDRSTGGARELDPAVFSTSDYSSYEDNTLEQLAAQGDVTAMQVLAMRLMTQQRSEKNIDKAKELMNEAAARGARHYPFKTLAAEAGFKLELALEEKIGMDEAEMQKNLVETFAYAELAAIRGNPQLKHAMREKYVERYDVQLSTEQWSDIRSRAESMYGRLQSKREQLGLGPFDNASGPDGELKRDLRAELDTAPERR